jgi:RHS repeat-associated protein
MTYDGEGHRTKVIETPAAGSPVTTREFRYQGDAVVEEAVNGTIIRSTIVDENGTPTKVLVSNSGAANGTYLPTWNGHGDLLALWRVETDGTLTLANSVTYDTWGRPSVSTHNGVPALGWTRLYVGQFDVWWDDSFGAGLLYMHARHYSPTLGRFLQPDPDGSETNLYSYAGNNPITKIDPSGRLWWFVAAAIAVVVRVAVVVVRVVPAVVRAVKRLAPATAAAWLRWQGYQWGPHLAKHGISLFQIARAILLGQRFRYFHQGVCKVGFFLSSTGLFVATSPGKWIYTAFVPDNPSSEPY